MTENEVRAKVVAQAKAWLGLSEPTSYLPILECYNAWARTHGAYVMTKADPWCAMYIGAVSIKCGVTAVMPVEVSCDRMIAQYKALGRYVENDAYVPKPADVIFYDWQDDGNGDNQGSSDHVGLVAAVSGSTITVIEGNCSDAVKTIYRTVNQRYIRGYGCPDYAKLADGQSEDPADAPTPAPEPAAPMPQTWITQDTPLPILREGCEGTPVENLQVLLIAHGYYCGGKIVNGREKPDGEFGAKTGLAVRRFQELYDLDVDGVTGKDTWLTLIMR